MQFFRVRRDQRREQWRHTAVLGAFIINNAGMVQPKHPARPEQLAPHAFPNRTRVMSRERMRRNLNRHEERLRRDSDA